MKIRARKLMALLLAASMITVSGSSAVSADDAAVVAESQAASEAARLEAESQAASEAARQQAESQAASEAARQQAESQAASEAAAQSESTAASEAAAQSESIAASEAAAATEAQSQTVTEKQTQAESQTQAAATETQTQAAATETQTQAAATETQTQAAAAETQTQAAATETQTQAPVTETQLVGLIGETEAGETEAATEQAGIETTEQGTEAASSETATDAQSETATDAQSESANQTEEQTEEKVSKLTAQQGHVTVKVTLPKGKKLSASTTLTVEISKADENTDAAAKAEAFLQKGHRVLTQLRIFTLHVTDESGSEAELPEGTQIEYTSDKGFSLELSDYARGSAHLLDVSGKEASEIAGEIKLSDDGNTVLGASFTAKGKIRFCVAGDEDRANEGLAVSRDDIISGVAEAASYGVVAVKYDGKAAVKDRAGTEEAADRLSEELTAGGLVEAEEDEKTQSADTAVPDEEESDSAAVAVQKADPEAILSSLSAYSLSLADALSSDTVTVVNLYTDENGAVTIDPSDSRDPMNQVLTADGRIDVTDRTVVINIVAASGSVANISVPKLGVAVSKNGTYEDVDAKHNSSLAGRVVYNVTAAATGTEEGSLTFAAYTGSVSVSGGAVGTYLAPGAALSVDGKLTGAAYAYDVTTGKVKAVTVTGEASAEEDGGDDPDEEDESETDESEAETGETEEEASSETISDETESEAVTDETESEESASPVLNLSRGARRLFSAKKASSVTNSALANKDDGADSKDGNSNLDGGDSGNNGETGGDSGNNGETGGGAGNNGATGSGAGDNGETGSGAGDNGETGSGSGNSGTTGSGSDENSKTGDGSEKNDSVGRKDADAIDFYVVKMGEAEEDDQSDVLLSGSQMVLYQITTKDKKETKTELTSWTSSTDKTGQNIGSYLEKPKSGRNTYRIVELNMPYTTNEDEEKTYFTQDIDVEFTIDSEGEVTVTKGGEEKTGDEENEDEATEDELVTAAYNTGSKKLTITDRRIRETSEEEDIVNVDVQDTANKSLSGAKLKISAAKVTYKYKDEEETKEATLSSTGIEAVTLSHAGKEIAYDFADSLETILANVTKQIDKATGETDSIPTSVTASFTIAETKPSNTNYFSISPASTTLTFEYTGSSETWKLNSRTATSSKEVASDGQMKLTEIAFRDQKRSLTVSAVRNSDTTEELTGVAFTLTDAATGTVLTAGTDYEVYSATTKLDVTGTTVTMTDIASVTINMIYNDTTKNVTSLLVTPDAASLPQLWYFMDDSKSITVDLTADAPSAVIKADALAHFTVSSQEIDYDGKKLSDKEDISFTLKDAEGNVLKPYDAETGEGDYYIYKTETTTNEDDEEVTELVDVTASLATSSKVTMTDLSEVTVVLTESRVAAGTSITVAASGTPSGYYYVTSAKTVTASVNDDVAVVLTLRKPLTLTVNSYDASNNNAVRNGVRFSIIQNGVAITTDNGITVSSGGSISGSEISVTASPVVITFSKTLSEAIYKNPEQYFVNRIYPGSSDYQFSDSSITTALSKASSTALNAVDIHTKKSTAATGSIIVGKQTLNADGTALYANKALTFYAAIYRQDGTLAAPAQGITVAASNYISSNSTVFSNLPLGAYIVRETDANGTPLSSTDNLKIQYTYGGKTADTAIVTLTEDNVLSESTNLGSSGDAASGGQKSVTIVNKYTTPTSDFASSGTFAIQVNVVDENGNPLAADVVATFRIRGDDGVKKLRKSTKVKLENESTKTKSDISFPINGSSSSMTVTMMSIADSAGNNLNTTYTVDKVKKTFTLKAGDKNATTLVFTLKKFVNKKSTATLSLTKSVTYKKTPVRVNATYYIGIFTDAGLTKMLYKKAMTLSDASSKTSELKINLYKLPSPHTITLYFAEVDKNGTVVKGGKKVGYDISFNVQSVTLSPESNQASVVCTNNVRDGSKAEKKLTDPDSGFAGDTAALAEAQALTASGNLSDGKKTGDSTPIAPFAAAAAASALALIGLGIFRRRKRRRG